MTYQVLARKWRPKTFAELVGQEHVVQALTNALTRGRLHHAYLLTGTRGVGKTTIARILAKSLNCVTGVTATPCGVCPACTDIDAGRFVDLLELDAASNTGIANMREILDNARYAPTVGRYKVYLIDEVHMLSKAAFNSMLKTLEEPPEHVKFVLATTDPQKIPVTVLSRCLQFNLKQLPPALIVARLATILEAEEVASDVPALTLLARAAQGSMRDALSLLDQAIAYGGGEVREPVVRTMLGAVDTQYIYRIVDALLAGDGAALLAEADAMRARSIAFAAALDELASLFHRIAIAQVVPDATETMDDAALIANYATKMTTETVQLAYQICVQGRADLALAPDEATGFAMTLLRLLAFEPTAGGATAIAGSDAPRRTSSPLPSVTEGSRLAVAEPTAAAVAQIPSPASRPARSLPIAGAEWPAFVASLKLGGIVGQLAAQTELVRCEGRELVLALPEAQRHLTDKAYVDKLKVALDEATGSKLRLTFELCSGVDASLAAQDKREREERKAREEAAFADEPFVREVLARFDARIRPGSVKPIS
jgi:DNA polymerase-3 subunit gamma/tau